MIKEDNKYIIINNRKELNKLNILKSSRYGSNSIIYYYKKSISELINLEKIQKLNITNISNPIKFIFMEESFYGYSMEYKKGIVLANIKENINYNSFITSLHEVEKTIKILSENNIYMLDLNLYNILYDNIKKLFNIVDIDNYIIKNNISKSKIYLDNIHQFENIILFFICYNYKFLNKKLYNDLESILKHNTNLSLIEKFKLIKDYLENYKNEEIKTIKDIRKILKKENK